MCWISQTLQSVPHVWISQDKNLCHYLQWKSQIFCSVSDMLDISNFKVCVTHNFYSDTMFCVTFIKNFRHSNFVLLNLNSKSMNLNVLSISELEVCVLHAEYLRTWFLCQTLWKTQDSCSVSPMVNISDQEPVSNVLNISDFQFCVTC